MNLATKPEPMFPIDLENCPKIILGGREWPIPQFAIRQAKEIAADLMMVMPKLSALLTTVAAPGAAVGDMTAAMASVDRDTLERISSMVFWSLKRVNPGLARAEFEDMPIALYEMFEALPVIIRQVGFIKAGTPGVHQMGEDQPPATAASTGTS